LRVYDRVRSEFTRVIESNEVAVLEWTSNGSLPDGQPIQYDGVSILELSDGHVKRFRTFTIGAVHPSSRTQLRGS
jgi:ketosteroid isomerase-like protein